MKGNKDFLVKIIGILGVLLLISVFFNIRGGSMAGVTGSSVRETVVICNDNYMRHGDGCCLDLNSNLICDEDEKTEIWGEQKESLLEQIKSLEARVKDFESEEEVEKETCPVVCAEDEMCVPVNKADGSIKWLCVDDPEHMLGAS